MSNKFDKINKLFEGKTFEYNHKVRFKSETVKAYYQFHIDKVVPLISVGEMTDHLFVSVKLVNGEGMINLYLSSAVFSTKQKVIGRENVTNFWFEFYVQVGRDIEYLLKFFNIDIPVIVDNFEFAPSKDFIPIYNFENEK